jgi:phospholipase C
VAGSRTRRTSILRFVEDNWLGGRRIAGSFDSLAGGLGGLLDCSHANIATLLLDPATGAPMHG